MLAQKKYFCGWSSLFYLTRRFQSIHAGHVDIQSHDIGLKILRLRRCLRAIRSVAYHIKIGLSTKECANCLPGDRMVVNDENMRHLAHAHPNRTLAANRAQSYTLYRLEPQKIVPQSNTSELKPVREPSISRTYDTRRPKQESQFTTS